jgi:hypothetical protein
MYEKCAGLDVHKRTVVVCATILDAKGQRHKERQTWSTMTSDLLRLRQWLKDLGVTHVAMESTATAVFTKLEPATIELFRISCRPVRNEKKRKIVFLTIYR